MSAGLSRLRLFQQHLRSLVWVWVWVWDWIHWHTSPTPPFCRLTLPGPGRGRGAAETLRLNTTFTSLDLGHNDLGDGAGRALAEMAQGRRWQK
jgi:hypothetical protein